MPPKRSARIRNAKEKKIKQEMKAESDLGEEDKLIIQPKIKVVKPGKSEYICKKCDASFWCKRALEAHIPIHVLKKTKQSNKRFCCDVCGREFNKLCDIERHTRVHTGEKPWACSICKKRFQQSHNLSKHLLIHSHVKPYHCEICNKQFGRPDILNRHLLIHSDEKPIKCAHCPKSFIRLIQLNNHMQKNHLDKLSAVSTKPRIKVEVI